MSADAAGQPTEQTAEQPIIIVRRSRGGHDDHHGGAWKIAYADFMTAMMALFLVLWLVNASSEETKAAVASYFNPIELTDRNARPRGIDDPAEGSPGMVEGEEGPNETAGARETAASVPATATDGSDDASPSGPSSSDGFVRFPTGPAETMLDAAGGGPLAPTREGGRNDPDPFDPFALGAASLVLSPGVTITPMATVAAVPARDGAPSPAVETAPKKRSGSADTGNPDGDGQAGDASRVIEAVTASGPPAHDAANVVPTPTAASAARAIAAELADALASAEVEVVAEADTVVIRLADDPARGMFALGSAAPRADLSGDLAKVAASLTERPGAVSVHGHTDARAFAGTERGEGNWRLSADRAGAAHALLVAGGLDPARVARVVAHADRSPREADALSPRNRRIEIRLTTGGGDGD